MAPETVHKLFLWLGASNVGQSAIPDCQKMGFLASNVNDHVWDIYDEWRPAPAKHQISSGEDSRTQSLECLLRDCHRGQTALGDAGEETPCWQVLFISSKERAPLLWLLICLG